FGLQQSCITPECSARSPDTPNVQNGESLRWLKIKLREGGIDDLGKNALDKIPLDADLFADR
ncbi:hypothetical protein O5287_29565, partial [Escherichia coli]|nr:hypothetical protein [Escherichia coli]